MTLADRVGPVKKPTECIGDSHKAPGKEHGVCGCTEARTERCTGTLQFNEPRGNCACKGHLGTGNAERTTWHAQLSWREACAGGVKP